MNPLTKRASELIGLLAIVVFLTAGVRYAYSQTAPPAESQAGGQTFMHRAPGMPGGMAMPGPMGMPGRMGMPGMEMCGMMPGMGMMPPPMMMRLIARNPKLAGKMMQMHADMMRAIADVLTKYGKEMESGQWPAAQKGGEDE